MSSAAPRPARVELAPGYDVCRVVTGCWQLAEGHRLDGLIEESAALTGLGELVDAGLDTFDVADIYTGAEVLLGRLVRDLPGATLRIHTKLVPDLEALPGLRRRDVEAVVDRSLARLGVERLDLVQLHWWDYSIPGFVEAASWLADLRRAGKVRHVGVTNVDAERLRMLLDAGVPVVSNQVQCSLLDRRPEESGLAGLCLERGVVLLAYGTLAGGLLAGGWLGKGDPGDEVVNRSLVKYRLIVDEAGGWERLQSLLAVLAEIAVAHRVPPASVAIWWALQRPAVAAAIVGFSTPARPQTLNAALELDPTPEERHRIDTAVAQLDPLPGPVYGLERRPGRHRSIMKTNLQSTGH